MKRALLLAVAVLVGACGGGGDDEPTADDTETTVTTQADRSGEAKQAFTDYITALLGGDYQAALDRSKGAAADIAGYFNTLSRIPTLPADFQVPKRQVGLTFDKESATRAPDGSFTLDARVAADITGGGADEQTTYSDIRLEDEDGKLVVVDFVRGEDGPVSEDVYRISGAQGEGNGIKVQMGPGFGMRGAIGRGGVRFSNFVFAYTNNTDYTISVRATQDNVLNFTAALDTDVKRYRSSTAAGTQAAPGTTGFGFLFFNDQVEGGSGTFSIEFVDEDDDEYEVEVSVSRLV